MRQKEKKLKNVFKVFNNQGNKRDKKNVRPPIKCGDDTILPETIKDAYINGNYGSHADRSPTEEEEDLAGRKVIGRETWDIIQYTFSINQE